MVFLNSLSILDTGFLATDVRTSQLTGSNRVNTGTALNLRSVEFTVNATSNIDKAVVPGKYTKSQHAIISINPTEVTIRLIVNTNSSNDYEGNDLSTLQHLIRLPHTLGWKALYYPVDNTATNSNDRNSQLVYQLGSTDTSESQGDINLTLWTGAGTARGKDLTDVNYLPVRFESCEINDTPTNIINVTLRGVVTA